MKVFISHAYTDEPFVKKVVTGLEKVGLEVWDATREILPGDNWADKVARALKESEAMVAFSLQTLCVQIGYVGRSSEQSYRNRLIPVIVGDPQELPKEDVPWILRRLHMIDMGEYAEEEEGINQIAQVLLNAA